MDARILPDQKLSLETRDALFRLIDGRLKGQGLSDEECRAFFHPEGTKALTVAMYRKYRTSKRDHATQRRLFEALDRLNLQAFRTGPAHFELREKPRDKLTDYHPMSINGLGRTSNERRGIHYFCYYRSSRRTNGAYQEPHAGEELADTRVIRAHMMLDPVNRTAFFAFYKALDENVLSQGDVTDHLEAARVYVLRGNYEWLRQEYVYIRFKENEVRHRHESPGRIGDYSQAVQITYPETEDLYQNRLEFVAAYTSWEPAGGLCYLQRLEVRKNRTVLNDLFTDAPIPPFVSRLLTGRSFSKHLDPYLFEPGVYRKLIEDLKPWVGYYEGYYMRSLGKRLEIRQLIIEVYDGYKMRYYSHDKNGSISYGFIADYESNKIHCCLHRNARLGHHLIHLCLTPNHNFDPSGLWGQRVLVGIHGGHRGDGSGPDAGRVMLFKLPDSEAPRHIEGAVYQLGDTQKIDALFKRRPQLRQFFAGRSDNYLDSIVAVNSRVLLRERFHQLGDLLPSNTYSGHFLSLRRSTRHPVVYQSLVHVDESGRAERWIVYAGRPEENRLEGELTGKPHLPLRLNFYRKYYRPTSAGAWASSPVSRSTLIPDPSTWQPVATGQPITEKHCRVGVTLRAGLDGSISSFKEYFIYLGTDEGVSTKFKDCEYEQVPEAPIDAMLKTLIGDLLDPAGGAADRGSSTSIRINGS